MSVYHSRKLLIACVWVSLARIKLAEQTVSDAVLVRSVVLDLDAVMGYNLLRCRLEPLTHTHTHTHTQVGCVHVYLLAPCLLSSILQETEICDHFISSSFKLKIEYTRYLCMTWIVFQLLNLTLRHCCNIP